jgi:hypothetical protein
MNLPEKKQYLFEYIFGTRKEFLESGGVKIIYQQGLLVSGNSSLDVEVNNTPLLIN